MAGLTAKFVQNAKEGRHCDGRGLYLLVGRTGCRSWILRVQVRGKRRDIGLGGVIFTVLGRPSEVGDDVPLEGRSEEHTSELQSLMRISYAVFCLKKKKYNTR